jgi:haloalkane dehalogenase
MTAAAAVLRTPEACFRDLRGFDYAPHYLEVQHTALGALRMAAIDEGPRAAPVALLLHGEPTWSYLYRKMIPHIVAAGFRAVAPDFIGFGRSDKPRERAHYSYAGFVSWLQQFVSTLGLRQITLVCQDWGGPIGLSLLAQEPQRFAAVLAANTLLPNCEPPPAGVAEWPGAVIEDWVATAAAASDLPVSGIIAAVCRSAPPAEVLHGYDAPFPDASYKSGVLAFPGLIPIRAELAGVSENRRVWSVLEQFRRPFVTAFSDSDPTTAPWAEVFRRRIPGAAGQPHALIRGAGHFLQEEQGEALAAVLLDLLRRVAHST